ncbi:SAC3/GANP family protein [Entamoeba marina]
MSKQPGDNSDYLNYFCSLYGNQPNTPKRVNQNKYQQPPTQHQQQPPIQYQQPPTQYNNPIPYQTYPYNYYGYPYHFSYQYQYPQPSYVPQQPTRDDEDEHFDEINNYINKTPTESFISSQLDYQQKPTETHEQPTQVKHGPKEKDIIGDILLQKEQQIFGKMHEKTTEEVKEKTKRSKSPEELSFKNFEKITSGKLEFKNPRKKWQTKKQNKPHYTPSKRTDSNLFFDEPTKKLKLPDSHHTHHSQQSYTTHNPTFITIGDQKNSFVGRSKQLEKSYFRLKGEADEYSVRNEDTLKKSLVYVLDKYNKSLDYAYLCDQLKAIRQDLTIQHVNNDFAVHVYKTHAKYAIRNNDISEFNQCVNMLSSLFKQLNYPIGDNEVIRFKCYEILYTIYAKSQWKALVMLRELPTSVRQNPLIEFAFNVKRCYDSDNYHGFFQLYRKSSKTCRAIMLSFIDRMRQKALWMICSSILPTYPLSTFKEILCLDEAEAKIFIKKYNIVIDNDGNIKTADTINSLGRNDD